jgi:hypothetical protein
MLDKRRMIFWKRVVYLDGMGKRKVDTEWGNVIRVEVVEPFVNLKRLERVLLSILMSIWFGLVSAVFLLVKTG